MKLSVGKRADGLDWKRSEDRAGTRSYPVSGGRFQCLADLSGWMPILAGIFLVADFISILRLPVLVEYFLAGVVLGATIGKGLIVRRERRGGELPAERVRVIEWAWIGTGVLAMAVAVAVQVALALL